MQSIAISVEHGVGFKCNDTKASEVVERGIWVCNQEALVVIEPDQVDANPKEGSEATGVDDQKLDTGVMLIQPFS